jgi:hypothetical protein
MKTWLDYSPQIVFKFEFESYAIKVIKVNESKNRVPTNKYLGQLEVTEANAYEAPHLIFSFIA